VQFSRLGALGVRPCRRRRGWGSRACVGGTGGGGSERRLVAEEGT